MAGPEGRPPCDSEVTVRETPPEAGAAGAGGGVVAGDELPLPATFPSFRADLPLRRSCAPAVPPLLGAGATAAPASEGVPPPASPAALVDIGNIGSEDCCCPPPGSTVSCLIRISSGCAVPMAACDMLPLTARAARLSVDTAATRGLSAPADAAAGRTAPSCAASGGFWPSFCARRALERDALVTGATLEGDGAWSEGAGLVACPAAASRGCLAVWVTGTGGASDSGVTGA